MTNRARDRGGSLPAAIARLGFDDPERVLRLLSDPAVADLIHTTERIEDEGLAASLSRTADPDAAALGMVRLMETASADAGLYAAVTSALSSPGQARERVTKVLGASVALADHLVAHPGQWRAVAEAVDLSAHERMDRLVGAVRDAMEERAAAGSEEGDAADPVDVLRIAYREQLLGIAALDVTAEEPTERFERSAEALADLAAAALEAALVIASGELGPAAEQTRLAVIAMGKTGGRELNYISDVDVIFVAEPGVGPDGEPVDEAVSTALAADLAARVMRVCGAHTAAGSLWEVDPALRPEGKAGPLVRTVASHRAYYERWAKTWEFQALLKARPVAGDAEVGQAYIEAMNPFVWQAASRENFVDEVQAMRRRVEQHVPRAEADRQIKLGPGGLRDIEFSVQLLQLVHGRSDEALRSRNTLEALAALSAGGYVGREDAATLADAYRFLRTLEHRIQLHRLRRTHVMPSGAGDLRRLGRALGLRSQPDEQIVARWRARQREVRRLHERIFYRPLLSAVARLSRDEARLTPEAARERLSALGFRDPRGALRHLEALTEGPSRRAALQRQLLPVMLGWFADEADPDAGLLAFRRISDELGSTPWYLRLLRDEGSAAERLAHTLARSRYAGDLLEQAPESVQFLGDPKGLSPRTRDEILTRMRAAAGRRDTAVDAIAAARVIRRSELFRIAVADLTGRIGLGEVGAALTAVTTALIEVALEQVTKDVVARTGGRPLTRMLVVGMGRLGGGEQSYGSDADVLFVHDPVEGGSDGVDAQAAQDQAVEIVKELVKVLGQRGPDPIVEIDTDLRPEGKNGPLVRSLASYAEYYGRWAHVWERHALVRATPVAGDESLAERFVGLIDPLRWPEGGLSAEQLRDIRRLKARMEAERLPRGADRKTHLKLGHGGLSDVEWVVQLTQLRHAHEQPSLRTPSTLEALDAAVAAGLIDDERGTDLRRAWELASRIRNAGVLFRSRGLESLPSDPREADGVARILGMPAGSGEMLTDTYRRYARRARTAHEQLFYD
ncbi:bifunctional [glutamine synthetase] adenylyltransferase/[glutamine synthetase]-adenylyl-L-tyrosine phosphorylase [Nostocoides sp. F2B08]|uniref:bifunctional [glutamine synthetase] adenylyltransferase/[glutamine synthetase]-adenylyl-L-tyrosine phosphorylase n=1 Tax=Nostocoides sp. F2B08 TaxID=2653936 RepID=UPI001262EF42|nr:bifunctional [glutamine synthetase] adenylyltransferase/[glutamine synthetase]-adenylyl-L-tyrosine phosphorylase [Tetrasphaera sp. F2B08]KAB7744664.1 bifunctional [glutamine synthetase] adenylyltransferase/[glutamine synthetase]-adenylyl-L-tyrosine phosphorylase [Tetrasphaera sp. F2B08]